MAHSLKRQKLSNAKAFCKTSVMTQNCFSAHESTSVLDDLKVKIVHKSESLFNKLKVSLTFVFRSVVAMMFSYSTAHAYANVRY